MNARKAVIGTTLIFLGLSGQMLFADDAALADKLKTRGGSSGSDRRDNSNYNDPNSDVNRDNNIDNNLNNRLAPGLDQPNTNTEINNYTDNGSTTTTPPNSNSTTTNPQIVTNPNMTTNPQTVTNPNSNTTTGRPNTMPAAPSP